MTGTNKEILTDSGRNKWDNRHKGNRERQEKDVVDNMNDTKP